MSTELDLLSLDSYSLRKVVEKMSTKTSTNLFSCSSEIEKLMDRLKPIWKLEETSIHYYGNSHRELYRSRKAYSKPLKKTCSLDFVKIPRVVVSKCDEIFLNSVVLPELRGMAPVESLSLGYYVRDTIKKVINAAQPKLVLFSDRLIDPRDTVFQNIPNLDIWVNTHNTESYWRTSKLIDLSKNHKQIRLGIPALHSDLVHHFLKNWLKGESYSLEELSVYRSPFPRSVRFSEEELMPVLVSEELQVLIKKCVKNLEGNFEIYREDGKKMNIVFKSDDIRFSLM